MTDIEIYLKSCFDVTEQDALQIAPLFKPARLKKGDYYIKTGDACNTLSFILSGYLRAYASVREKEVTQWIASKGSFVADLAGLTFHTPSRWNITALTDVELVTMHKEEYLGIANRIPLWPAIEKRFIVKCFTYMENRIFGLLSMPAEERYEIFFEEKKELFNQVPLHYIASMLGMTPETFSRIRKNSR